MKGRDGGRGLGRWNLRLRPGGCSCRLRGICGFWDGFRGVMMLMLWHWRRFLPLLLLNQVLQRFGFWVMFGFVEDCVVMCVWCWVWGFYIWNVSGDNGRIFENLNVVMGHVQRSSFLVVSWVDANYESRFLCLWLTLFELCVLNDVDLNYLRLLDTCIRFRLEVYGDFSTGGY